MQKNTEEKTQKYRSVAKGTALMGGVQVFNILINVVKGKLVAMFLGPAGMGVVSLLTSSTNVVQQFSCLGLNLAIVKEIAGADSKEKQKPVIVVVRRLLLLTAILGALLTLVLSPWLSTWSFGDRSYTIHFIFLGIMVFFTTLSNGEASILQGAHTIKRLAYSSLVGSFVGLLVGVPLYYFYGQDGIVPAMIALSIATFAFYKYHSYKEFGRLRMAVSWKEHSFLIKAMIAFGFISMISALLGTFVNYGVNAYVRFQGALHDVGLFQAANSITNQYVGLVFTAMSVDYFPRLSAVSSDNRKVCEAVNLQAEIVLLVVAPIVMLMILLAPLIIRILLTGDFLSLGPVIRVMAVGIFLKAISFPMGYISFAKGDKKTFFWLEGVWGNVITLSLNILFYYFWGLIGLGISMVCIYSIIMAVYFVVTNKLYEYKVDRTVLMLISVLGGMIALCYCASLISNTFVSYGVMGLVFAIASAYSVKELNKRMDVVTIIKTKLNGKC